VIGFLAFLSREACLSIVSKDNAGAIITEGYNAGTLRQYMGGSGDPDFGPFLRFNPIAVAILLSEVKHNKYKR